MRVRFGMVAIVVALVAAACSSSGSSKDTSSGLDATTTVPGRDQRGRVRATRR